MGRLGFHNANVTCFVFGVGKRVGFFYDRGRPSGNGGDSKTGQWFHEPSSSNGIGYERGDDVAIDGNGATGVVGSSSGEQKSRVEIINSVRESYHSLLGYCLSKGLSYHDFLSMTMNEINAFIESNIKSREQHINDMLFIAHTQSALTSQAVWGSKDFPKDPPRIKVDNPFKPKTKEEIIAEILKFQKAVHNEIVAMNKIYGSYVGGGAYGK